MVERTDVNDTRTRILDAAQAVLTRGGLAAFTLEAVAREAAISKGGLLYHFASKEALTSGMVVRYVELFEASLRQALEAEPTGPGRQARAIVKTTLADSALHSGYKRALFHVAAGSPEVLDPFRAYAGSWLEALADDGLPSGVAAAVCFAADGIWFSRILGLLELSDDQRREIEARLLELTRPGGLS